MIRGRLLPPGADIAQALRVRAAVFGQGAADETDAQSWHALVYDRVDENGEPVGDACGAGRIWWQDGAFHIGRVAVMPDRRGLGLGDLLMRMLLFKALEHGARAVVAHAPKESAAFCARYGFPPERAVPDPDGVALRAAAEQIDLSGSCCGR